MELEPTPLVFLDHSLQVSTIDNLAEGNRLGRRAGPRGRSLGVLPLDYPAQRYQAPRLYICVSSHRHVSCDTRISELRSNCLRQPAGIPMLRADDIIILHRISTSNARASGAKRYVCSDRHTDAAQYNCSSIFGRTTRTEQVCACVSQGHTPQPVEIPFDSI